MYGIISKYKLEHWLDNRENLLLIDVLPEKDFARQHIPGSVNIPYRDSKLFIEEVEKYVPSRNSRIIVYCTGINYDPSKSAARKLENAGFFNIYAFEHGVESLIRQSDNPS